MSTPTPSTPAAPLSAEQQLVAQHLSNAKALVALAAKKIDKDTLAPLSPALTSIAYSGVSTGRYVSGKALVDLVAHAQTTPDAGKFLKEFGAFYKKETEMRTPLNKLDKVLAKYDGYQTERAEKLATQAAQQAANEARVAAKTAKLSPQERAQQEENRRIASLAQEAIIRVDGKGKATPQKLGEIISYVAKNQSATIEDIEAAYRSGATKPTPKPVKVPKPAELDLGR